MDEENLFALYEQYQNEKKSQEDAAKDAYLSKENIKVC